MVARFPLVPGAKDAKTVVDLAVATVLKLQLQVGQLSINILRVISKPIT
jgi:hypothetical protein